MAKKKAKVVKGKVSTPPKKTKHIAKRYQRWEVWSMFNEKIGYDEGFSTQEGAEQYIAKEPNMIAPVIIHIDIPPMEY